MRRKTQDYLPFCTFNTERNKSGGRCCPSNRCPLLNNRFPLSTPHKKNTDLSLLGQKKDTSARFFFIVWGGTQVKRKAISVY
ncbi:hypothetical protein CEXT_22861 [Caerostris extrusa]|uniref:Uncharacterized protein n=1 Tax=Caerostris extrusa TaxID=172846 RepID=A0AAV4VBC9_CAEEX|nr:hypothetical protein CEXT_22861 [Caerostris extrusa]